MSILKLKKAAPFIVLMITWVAFFVRVLNLSTQSLWRDEVDAIRFSNWAVHGLIAGLVRTGHNGPLFFVLLYPWRNLVGDSEFALRYPSALLGALAVPLGFVLARQLGFSRTTGLLSSLLLATSPYLIWYGQEAKMYTLLLVLVTLAFIAYLKALNGDTLPLPFKGEKQSWVWWGVFIVITTLSYYVHLLTPLMLPVYGFTALLYYRQLRRHWRGWVISMAILTLPYIPLALWQIPLLLDSYQSGHPFYPFKKQFYLLLQLYSSGLIRFAPADALTSLVPNFPSTIITYLQKLSFGLIPIVLFVFLFLSGLLLKPKDKKISITRRLILLGWTLIPSLAVYFISLRVHIFEDRYLIYIAPAFYLLIASGLVLVGSYSRRLAGLCLALILLFNLTGIWQQQRQPIKADFRAAAEYLENQPHLPSTIMIQTPYLQHTLNYYYPHSYTLLEGLWTNNGQTETTVDVEMTALTVDLTNLWLIVSEEDLWDNRHLVRAWLDNNTELVDQAHFMRVDVYYYQLRPGIIEKQSMEMFDD